MDWLYSVLYLTCYSFANSVSVCEKLNWRMFVIPPKQVWSLLIKNWNLEKIWKHIGWNEYFMFIRTLLTIYLISDLLLIFHGHFLFLFKRWHFLKRLFWFWHFYTVTAGFKSKSDWIFPVSRNFPKLWNFGLYQLKSVPSSWRFKKDTWRP